MCNGISLNAPISCVFRIRRPRLRRHGNVVALRESRFCGAQSILLFWFGEKIDQNCARVLFVRTQGPGGRTQPLPPAPLIRRRRKSERINEGERRHGNGRTDRNRRGKVADICALKETCPFAGALAVGSVEGAVRGDFGDRRPTGRMTFSDPFRKRRFANQRSLFDSFASYTTYKESLIICYRPFRRTGCHGGHWRRGNAP